MAAAFLCLSCSHPLTDPALAAWVCTQHIAETPGTLTLLPVGTAGAPQNRAYAEYVPPDYAYRSGWPCIISLHGDGELGDGSTTGAMQGFLYGSLPGMIQADTWDNRKRFVVLAPQFVDYADRSAIHVHDFIQYAKANYRIDPKRIYLTAVSGGGVALGNYLNAYKGGEAAAALPVFCYLGTGTAAVCTNVPVWFIGGAADTTAKPANMAAFCAAYNGNTTSPPAAAARITLFHGYGHDIEGVNAAYNPSAGTKNGYSLATDQTMAYKGSAFPLSPYANVYDWFLQFHR